MASFSKMLIYPVVNFQISRCLWQAAAPLHLLALLSLLCKWTRSLSSFLSPLLNCGCVPPPLLPSLSRICGYLIYVRAFNLFSARLCVASCTSQWPLVA